MLNSTNIRFKIYWADGHNHDILPSSSVLALGTFDGVHSAHKALLDAAIDLKKELKLDFVGAWCFAQSPASFLRGEEIPSLTSIDEKIRLMHEYGMDFVAVGDFKDYCHIPADDFIDRVLVDQLHCSAVVCGFNHRFGHKGLGNSSLLKEKLGQACVVTVNEIQMFGETVSSTAIRNKILSGDITHANAMLGRYFTLETPVVPGKKLGRTMNFPTANQYFTIGSIVPKHGIYATLCTLENGKKYIGVSNVGVRPTITDEKDDHTANCETYICDFTGNIYGQMLKIEFCEYLREEKKFDSIEALKSSIEQDKNNAIAFFKSQKQ